MTTNQQPTHTKSNINARFSFTRRIIVLMTLVLSPLHAAPPTPLKVFETKKEFIGLDEEIYPMGWTKNGERLAVLRAHPNEAADERLWQVQVLDLVNDKAILDEEIRHLDKGGLPAFWAAHGKRVMALLAPHDIETSSFKLRRFPALLGKYRSEAYEFLIERTYGTEPNFRYRGLTSLNIKLSNQSGKTKVIYNKQWKEWYPMAAGVVGYLPNPKGDRIAILLGMTHRGYESAPHIRDLTIIGARLGEKF